MLKAVKAGAAVLNRKKVAGAWRSWRNTDNLDWLALFVVKLFESFRAVLPLAIALFRATQLSTCVEFYENCTCVAFSLSGLPAVTPSPLSPVQSLILRNLTPLPHVDSRYLPGQLQKCGLFRECL